MLDTGAGGGNYISLALWQGVKTLLHRSLDRSGAGALEPANPAGSDVSLMRILGSTTLPLLFDGDPCVRPVHVRVVEDLPYACISGSEYFVQNRLLDFSPGRGFRPTMDTVPRGRA